MYAAFKQLNWKHFIVLSADWGKTMMNDFKLMLLPPTVINYMADGADPLKGAAQQISQFVATTGVSVFFLQLNFWDHFGPQKHEKGRCQKRWKKAYIFPR